MGIGRGDSGQVDINLLKCYEIIRIEGDCKSNTENLNHGLRYPFSI